MAAELELSTSSRILAGTVADVGVYLRQDGQRVTPEGDITWTATDADGNEVGSGDATISGNLIQGTLSAAETIVNRLTVTFEGIELGDDPPIALTVEVEVVGANLFTVADARAFDMKQLQREAEYPNGVILEARDRITDQVLQRTGLAAGARYGVEVLDGDGSSTLLLAAVEIRELRQVAVRTRGTRTWTPLTEDQLAAVQFARAGIVQRETGSWPNGFQNVRVSYVHGLQPIPGELTRAGLLIATHQLTTKDTFSRTISVTNEQGTYTMAQPGVRGSYFGLPEADEILHQLRKRIPGVA